MLDTPRSILATERARLSNALTDLGNVLAADTDESLRGRIDLFADDLITALTTSIDRIRRAQTAVAAQRILRAPDGAGLYVAGLESEAA